MQPRPSTENGCSTVSPLGKAQQWDPISDQGLPNFSHRFDSATIGCLSGENCHAVLKTYLSLVASADRPAHSILMLKTIETLFSLRARNRLCARSFLAFSH
jgi:hypothetical protein